MATTGAATAASTQKKQGDLRFRDYVTAVWHNILSSVTTFSIGDADGDGNSTKITVNDGAQKITLSATDIGLDSSAATASEYLYLDALSNLTTKILSENAITLLSATTILLDTNADTTLYTVAAGKRCVLHSAILVAGKAASTTDISIGQDTAETDFVGVTNLDNLAATNDAVLLAPIPSATPATLKSYASGTVIQAQVTNAAGLTANSTIYLFGYTY